MTLPGFQVAMHDARRMRRRQRVGHLDRVLERLVQP